jgi:transcriptional regulator with XRE-family HTH domain
MIGKYERNEMSPSVDTAKALAKALDVSLDYLVGFTSTVVKDGRMNYRLELLEKLGKAERDRIMYVVDALLRDAQLIHTQQKLA